MRKPRVTKAEQERAELAWQITRLLHGVADEVGYPALAASVVGLLAKRYGQLELVGKTVMDVFEALPALVRATIEDAQAGAAYEVVAEPVPLLELHPANINELP